MGSISTSPDPETSILRYLATGLRDAIQARGLKYLHLEQKLGRAGGYLCRIAAREKTIGSPDAYRLANILEIPFDSLFEPDAASAVLLAEWRAGLIVALDGPHARFWSKVTPAGEADECMLWRGSCNAHGYGQFNLTGNRPVLASRHAYTLAVGPIPDGLDVLHRCDTPPCVRPDHLFLGTHLDNMRDMDLKGRRVNAGAKLTIEQVQAIRAIGPYTAERRREVAKRFGISVSNLNRILQRKAWKDT